MNKQIIKIIFIFLSQTFTFASSEPKEILVVSENWDELTNQDGSGLYFDIVRLIYEPKGIDVKVKIYPYNRSSKMVEEKQADMWLGSYVDEEDYAIYPKYYFDKDIVMAMFKTSKFPNFNGIESLENKRVCWIRGYDYNDYIDLKMVITERNNRQSALKSIENDRFDFFLDAEFDIKNAIKKYHFNDKDYSLVKILELDLYPAFTNDKKGEKLKQIWDEEFEKHIKDGSLKKIYIKHHLEKFYYY